MIAIVDYGIGNVASVKNMLYACGAESVLTSDRNSILNADKIILPGVGAFDTAMRRLRELQLVEVLKEYASTQKPLMGICLGSQLLLDKSEEGSEKGLGLISGNCKRFESSPSLKIPHMGWSEVHFTDTHPLVHFADVPRFYFVHSYYMVCDDADDILGTSSYGHDFASAIKRKNIFGFQFHPEKSHRFGMQLFKNFISL